MYVRYLANTAAASALVDNPAGWKEPFGNPTVTDPTARAGGLRLLDRAATGRLTAARQPHV